jgi:hypothetical protein
MHLNEAHIWIVRLALMSQYAGIGKSLKRQTQRLRKPTARNISRNGAGHSFLNFGAVTPTVQQW